MKIRLSAKRRRAAALAVAVGVASASGLASAQEYSVLDGFVAPGFMASYTFGRGFGLGGEVTFSHLPSRGQLPTMFGAFAQFEHLLWPGMSGQRGAIGLQGFHFLGVEAGAALQNTGEAARWQAGGHLGGYAALPMSYPMPLGGPPRFSPALSLAFRGTFPADGGVDLALVFTLKNVIPVGNAPYFGPVAGRPLRTRDGLLLPGICRATGAGVAAPSLTRHLSSRARDRLTAKWLQDARGEAASVPAFTTLAEDLAHSGAPAVLVSSALRAATDEIRHAQACLHLASAYSEERYFAAPSDIPDPSSRRAHSLQQELTRLATESWLDGCLGEGTAASTLRVTSELVNPPELRASVAETARDESRHAALAWGVVEWCLNAGGESVRYALREELERAQDTREAVEVEDSDDELEEHAILSTELSRAAALATRAAACARLEGLVA